MTEPRRPTKPVPGHYLLRLVPRGWETPCQIFEVGGRFSCEIDGETIPGSWTSEELEPIWADWLTAQTDHPMVKLQAHGRACDLGEYLYRIEYKKWAAIYQPQHPCVNPLKPINVNLLPADDF